ncbi:MAG: DMT family transporter, partial [Gemmataceae bacterium]
MAWWILIAAGVLEVVWAAALKASDGFRRPGAAVLFLVALVGSMTLLGIAVRTLPMGTAYAVWTGIGAVGTVLWAMATGQDAVHLGRLLCVGLIVAGIAGLRLLA